MISHNGVAKFKKLYLQQFNINLTDEQAIYLGTQLIKLVKLSYGSNLPKKWRSKKFDSIEAREVL
jgi:hypothetical protein